MFSWNIFWKLSSCLRKWTKVWRSSIVGREMILWKKLTNNITKRGSLCLGLAPAYLCFSRLIITSSFWLPNQRIPPHVEQLFVKVGLFQENLQLSSALSPSCWEIGEKSTIFHLSIRILARALRMVAGQGTNSSFSSSIPFGFASLTLTVQWSLWSIKNPPQVVTTL